MKYIVKIYSDRILFACLQTLKFQPIRAYYWPWQPCCISDWNEKLAVAIKPDHVLVSYNHTIIYTSIFFEMLSSLHKTFIQCITMRLQLTLPQSFIFFTYWFIFLAVNQTQLWRGSYSDQTPRGLAFRGDLRQDVGFLRLLRFPLPIKLTATISLKYC